jgi:hypothetical protein
MLDICQEVDEEAESSSVFYNGMQVTSRNKSSNLLSKRINNV